MNQKKDDNVPKSNEDFLKYILYHTGVFVFKIVFIIAMWVFAVSFLKKIFSLD